MSHIERRTGMMCFPWAYTSLRPKANGSCHFISFKVSGKVYLCELLIIAILV